MAYKAVIWDFGGVVTSSPFEAFNNFEKDNNLPNDLIRTINSENPDTNAWAKFERNQRRLRREERDRVISQTAGAGLTHTPGSASIFSAAPCAH